MGVFVAVLCYGTYALNARNSKLYEWSLVDGLLAQAVIGPHSSILLATLFLGQTIAVAVYSRLILKVLKGSYARRWR